MSAGLSIRDARLDDAALILSFIAQLAAYENLSDQAKATEADIVHEFFGASPRVFASIAQWDGKPVGFTVWFYTFSTFQGRAGIWLEDLFVLDSHRGKGIGKALLADLAQRCVTEQLGRLEWWVLDWNAPSIEFYKARGASMHDEWTKCRLEGEALTALGTP